MSKKIEFGDFQTPFSLAKKCVEIVSNIYKPDFVLEPTCGLGFFLEASVENWGKRPSYHGCEINNQYVKEFEIRCPKIFNKISVEHADFFNVNFNALLSNHKRPLVIGNPPWVTNSQLGVLSSTNLPEKSNSNGLIGFEALTGKSNFDISEWMIVELTELLREKRGLLAMLCKTSVARKVFLHNFKSKHKDVSYKIFKIDSKKEFGVSVDACLFICDYFNGGDESICEIYEELSEQRFSKKIGISGETIVSDIELHKITSDLVSGVSDKTWRSGVKHDAAKIMELTFENGALYNGLGEIVDVEGKYIYPLLKSSDLANNRTSRRKFVIVTQKKVGEETKELELKAPKLWTYLLKHSGKLDGRKSSIYKNRSRFSIFGVGDYSFMPYKVAISGLYKRINFCLLKPSDGKPYMVDDTCYLLGFETLKEAKEYLEILRSDLVTKYLLSIIFWDAKRPINADILKSIDVAKASASYMGYKDKIKLRDLSV